MSILNTSRPKINEKLRKIMYYELFIDIILDRKENSSFTIICNNKKTACPSIGPTVLNLEDFVHKIWRHTFNWNRHATLFIKLVN